MEINGEKVGLEQDQEFLFFKKRTENENDTAEVERKMK